MGDFEKDERNIRSLIEDIRREYRLGTGGNQAGTSAVAQPDSPPIPWKTPKRKKKSRFGGLISRLRDDPDPLSKSEKLQLKTALSSDTILNEGRKRTDEGALMNIRSQYPNY